MVRTWNVKGRGKVNDETVISSKYFIVNNCVSCGWGLHEEPNRLLIKDFESYKQKWKSLYEPKKKWGYQGVHHLFERVKKGDFLWTRLDGYYYVAEVPDDPIKLFQIDLSSEARKYDASIQLKNIKWKKVGKEDSVPGSISSFTSNRNPIVRVDNKEIEVNGYRASGLFSKQCLNPTFSFKLKDKSQYLYLIGPSGFEDLVALWLYDKFNYVVIPSTSKRSTQKYEFVLLDGTKTNYGYSSSKRICIQTKNGTNNLKLSDYEKLLDEEYELWLVTSRGKIYDENNNLLEESILCCNKTANGLIKSQYSLNELLEFAFDKKNSPILSKSLNKWREFFN